MVLVRLVLIILLILTAGMLVGYLLGRSRNR